MSLLNTTKNAEVIGEYTLAENVNIAREEFLTSKSSAFNA